MDEVTTNSAMAERRRLSFIRAVLFLLFESKVAHRVEDGAALLTRLYVDSKNNRASAKLAIVFYEPAKNRRPLSQREIWRCVSMFIKLDQGIRCQVCFEPFR